MRKRDVNYRFQKLEDETFGGGPSKKLDDETLETRVRGPSKKLDDETLETRVRQRSRLKSLIFVPGTLLAAGAAHPCTCRGGCRPLRR